MNRLISSNCLFSTTRTTNRILYKSILRSSSSSSSTSSLCIFRKNQNRQFSSNSIFKRISTIEINRNERFFSTNNSIKLDDDNNDESASVKKKSVNSKSTKKSTKSRKHDTTSPSMVQWHHIKDQYPGYLLFFQLGDFFELFYDDAIRASKLLGLTLTKRRSRYKNNNVQVPMAGVPVAQVDVYLQKFIGNFGGCGVVVEIVGKN
jgi:hypothetical protein